MLLPFVSRACSVARFALPIAVSAVALECLWVQRQYSAGRISHKERRQHMVTSCSGGAGGILGAVAVGAAVGSIVPGPGTVTGALAGGLLGSGLGRYLTGLPSAQLDLCSTRTRIRAADTD